MRTAAMSYRVEFSKAADRVFCKLPKSVQLQLQADINQLAQEPRPAGCKKLVGATNKWRVRSGNYRIIYEIHDAVLLVLIVDVGHRKDIYN
jgi:mRNA interferase RelE/StbE